MNQETLSHSKPNLSAIQKQFELWRKTRSTRSPIPKDLWDAAVSLANDHSIYHISRTLRLNYHELRRRVEKNQEGTKSKHSDSGQRFVQFDLGESMWPGAEWLFEMESTRGAKMKMTYRGRKEMEFIEAAKAFWEETR